MTDFLFALVLLFSAQCEAAKTEAWQANYVAPYPIVWVQRSRL